MTRQKRDIAWVWEEVLKLFIVGSELQYFWDGEGRVLRGVQVPHLPHLYGLLLLGHNRLHEIDVDGLVRRQVQTAVDSEEATTIMLESRKVGLLIDFLFALYFAARYWAVILPSGACICCASIFGS